MSTRYSDGFLKIPPSVTQKSKTVKTPFYFYMMEQKERMEREGKWNNSRPLQELIDAIYPTWKEKSKSNPEFLAPYIELHRGWKDSRERNLDNKYDSLGRPLADIRREALRVRRKEEEMNRDIENVVKHASSKVIHTNFYVAHFNYLCRTDKDFFIPCEAAIVEFNLEKGITKCWQEFISPLDSIPEGYRYRCIKYSRETHNISPDFEQYQSDYPKIMDSLQKFMNVGSKSIPPIYVMPTHKEVAECITQFITERSGSNMEFKVYPLPKLLQELCHFPNIFIAQHLMEEDNFSHNPGLACHLHESLQNYYHCSLSVCKRWIFTLVNACSNMYDLTLKPGRHLPPRDVERNLAHELEIQTSKLCIVREERINRFIPTPGGVTSLPAVFDTDKMVKKGVESNLEFSITSNCGGKPNWWSNPSQPAATSTRWTPNTEHIKTFKPTIRKKV